MYFGIKLNNLINHLLFSDIVIFKICPIFTYLNIYSRKATLMSKATWKYNHPYLFEFPSKDTIVLFIFDCWYEY